MPKVSTRMFRHRADQLRPTSTGDRGEWTTGAPSLIASDLPCLLSTPSGSEVRQADQFQGRVLYVVAFPADADVRKGDIFDVTTQQPGGGSHTVRVEVDVPLPGTIGYVKAAAELVLRTGQDAA